jgi:1,4-dihydroxy-2-naphthoate octaprenyltransferase
MAEALSASRPGPFRIWLLAIRPPTLTAAIAPVLVGTALAIRDDVIAAGPAAAALFGALALQVGANLANDVADFRRGADTETRLGPPRVTQQGLVTERGVTVGAVIAFGLAAAAGVYLTLVAGWIVIAIGLASIVAAIAYTAGPWPYGYRGLGDVFVFVFFGLLAVGGTYFVQAGELNGEVLFASIPVGLTVTAILNVNNVRDIDTDREAGKRTLAVRMGRRLARAQYVVTVVAAYLVAAGLWIVGDFPPFVLLVWLTLPLAIAPVRAVMRSEDGPTLNGALRATARLHLVFAVLLALGVTL